MSGWVYECVGGCMNEWVGELVIEVCIWGYIQDRTAITSVSSCRRSL